MQKILSVKNLTKTFFTPKKSIEAVKNVSFDIFKAQTFAIVGESGSGKSTIAKMITKLITPSFGDIYFEGKSIFDNASYSNKNIQMIFQDPFLSLNPKMRIKDIILEPIKIHKKLAFTEQQKLLKNLLEQVKLCYDSKDKFPHEFSGGQRQRIAIARALAINPKFVICDEPLSALDVSIGAQIIYLLLELQKSFSLSYLFISHDLAVVKHISNYIAVMYLGKFVEFASTKNLFQNPKHPYTQLLISASLIKQLQNFKQKQLFSNKGCNFANKCPYAKKICYEIEPILKNLAEEDFIACHLY